MKRVRDFSEHERAWIRLMSNPYASLALQEPEDEEVMIAPSKEQPIEKRPPEATSTDL